MKRDTFLAFDLGAESGRTIAGRIINEKLELEEIHRFPTRGISVNGSFRWDIYRLFDEIKNGIAKYVSQYGDSILSMGVDTWGLDFGILDERENLISIPYHYRDERTIGTETLLESKLTNRRIYSITGIQFMHINTLNQLVSMVEQGDPTLKIGEKLLFIGDILHFFLSPLQ